MKLPLLVFVALGLLAQVDPAGRGGTRCRQSFLGYGKPHSGQQELGLCLCDRRWQCCVAREFLTAPLLLPPQFPNSKSL